MGCMAHVRRKFMDVFKAGAKKRGTAQEVVDLIAQLYGLVKQARQAGFDEDRILTMRKNQSRQIMDTIKVLLLERGRTTPPKSLLGRAISYAWGSGSGLKRILKTASCCQITIWQRTLFVPLRSVGKTGFFPDRPDALRQARPCTVRSRRPRPMG